MAIGLAKPISFKPAAGLMDMRSDPSDIAAGHRRVVLNHFVPAQGKESRSGGWIRLFGETGYGFKNQDLHDQLRSLQQYHATNIDGSCAEETLVRTGCDEAVTFGFEVTSENGSRKLLIGTNQRLYELAERSGNYRIIADGLGNPTLNQTPETCQKCAGTRFTAAQLLGYTILTNGYDEVLSYRFGDAVSGCDLQAAHPIADLQSLAITRAGVVAQFKGFILLADIDMDGVTYPGMVLNSDFNSPLDFIPLVGTNLARNMTIGFSDKILAFEQFGDYLIAYTDRAIFRGQLNIQTVGDTVAQVFSFTEIYRGPNALKFRYSLVNTGTEHIWAAVDGVYRLGSPFGLPERVEWIHRATGAIYDGVNKWVSEFDDLPDGLSLDYGPINKNACDKFIGGFNPEKRELWFSWPTDDNECANLSLRLGMQPGFEHASLVDHGFSMFCFYHTDSRPSWREWLISIGACPSSAFEYVKEGDSQIVSNATPPANIWNATEDITAATDPDSLCGILGNTTLESICQACEPVPVFIGASTQDLCLKEFRDDVYQRERWTGTTYAEDGYFSFVQTNITELGSDVEKAFSRLNIELRAEPQTTPSQLYSQVGIGQQASCPQWFKVGSFPLKCQTLESLADRKKRFSRANTDPDYKFFYRGRYLSFRTWVSGTGGGYSTGRTDVYVRNAQS